MDLRYFESELRTLSEDLEDGADVIGGGYAAYHDSLLTATRVRVELSRDYHKHAPFMQDQTYLSLRVGIDIEVAVEQDDRDRGRTNYYSDSPQDRYRWRMLARGRKPRGGRLPNPFKGM